MFKIGTRLIILKRPRAPTRVHSQIAAKTKDILHVMNLLGHRNIESTLVYTHLISYEGDEYHSAVAKTVDEARGLIEHGSEYVCTRDETMIFKKRK